MRLKSTQQWQREERCGSQCDFLLFVHSSSNWSAVVQLEPGDYITPRVAVQ